MRSKILDFRSLGYWTFMFALSKVPELGDTLFIVLRKQPLIFLHWYVSIPSKFFKLLNFSVVHLAVLSLALKIQVSSRDGANFYLVFLLAAHRTSSVEHRDELLGSQHHVLLLCS